MHRVALILLVGLAAGCRSAQPARVVGEDHTGELHMTEAERDLDAFLAKVDDATQGMVNGDPSLWEQVYSHAPDATLFGGWGGREKGWEELSARWRMVTGRFRTGKMTFEPISRHVSGNLAITVQLVRGVATFSDGSGGKMGLRVTHVLRREAGEWRIVHRHADEQLKLLPISSHLQGEQ